MDRCLNITQQPTQAPVPVFLFPLRNIVYVFVDERVKGSFFYDLFEYRSATYLVHSRVFPGTVPGMGEHELHFIHAQGL